MPSLLLPLALVAFLYATVGHAGASGYIAVLALAGLPAAQIKPLALLLNLVVAAQGGWLDLPTLWFQRLVALVLLASALRFLQQPRDPQPLRTPPLPLLLLSGAGLGLLAGFTGTGGGVFLTPLLLHTGWASTRRNSVGSCSRCCSPVLWALVWAAVTGRWAGFAAAWRWCCCWPPGNCWGWGAEPAVQGLAFRPARRARSGSARCLCAGARSPR